MKQILSSSFRLKDRDMLYYKHWHARRLADFIMRLSDGLVTELRFRLAQEIIQ